MKMNGDRDYTKLDELCKSFGLISQGHGKYLVPIVKEVVDLSAAAVEPEAIAASLFYAGQTSGEANAKSELREWLGVAAK